MKTLDIGPASLTPVRMSELLCYAPDMWRLDVRSMRLVQGPPVACRLGSSAGATWPQVWSQEEPQSIYLRLQQKVGFLGRMHFRGD